MIILGTILDILNGFGISPVSMMDIEEMIKIVSKTGYMVEKDLKRGMRVTVSSYFIDVFM